MAHFGEYPHDNALSYMRDIVEKIRERVSNGNAYHSFSCNEKSFQGSCGQSKIVEWSKMKRDENYRNALAQLRAVMANRMRADTLRALIDAKDEVFQRYGPVFTPDGISYLDANAWREFLMFRNNKHWSGLQRMGPQTSSDMDALREALIELVDENRSVDERLDSLLPGRRARVHKLGKAILTPILMISAPMKYGVWNGTSEGAMIKLKIWPKFDRGISVGTQYLEINQLLLQIAKDLDTDLWTLDALWWGIRQESNGGEDGEGDGDGAGPDLPVGEDIRFGLERHLHDFLFDNWERTSLGKEWDLAEDGGDIKGYGYERPTEIGRIDLLAKHKSEPRWLVIELKRNQSSDDTVGQVLRYMGWVKNMLATNGESVEGLIIAHVENLKLKYALDVTQGVRFMRYEVDFKLFE